MKILYKQYEILCYASRLHTTEQQQMKEWVAGLDKLGKDMDKAGSAENAKMVPYFRVFLSDSKQ